MNSGELLSKYDLKPKSHKRKIDILIFDPTQVKNFYMAELS